MLGTHAADRAAGAVATLVADWRRFLDPRFRVFHRVAVLQGLTVLAGFDVLIPFALEIGCPPALTALLGALPIAGGMAQLAVPRLLARTEGNLRGLTLLAALLAEARGGVYVLIVLAVAAGLLGGPQALVLLALLIGVTGVLASVAGANLLAWYSAVLSEEDRRLVMPRLTVLTLGASALLLFPMGIALDVLAAQFGLLVYAVPFGISAVLGARLVVAVRQLPRPGRVIVPPQAAAGEAGETPAQAQFLRISTINALGMGLTPYFSVYAISVLGLSAGFAMTMSSVGQVAMLVAAVVGGAMVARGSSARYLRASFAMRACAVFLPVLALPGSAWAAAFMYATAVLAAIGFAVGQIAANERLFRLVRGPAVIRHHGQLLFRTSAAMTTGQVVSGLVLAAGGAAAYPAFAALFGASAAFRALAYRAARPELVGAGATPSTAPAAPARATLEAPARAT